MAGCLLPALPIEVEERIIQLLDPNEVICTVRLVNKAAAVRYRGIEPRPIVRLSVSIPHHAFAHRCEANSGAWIKTLSFKRRLKLLCLVAASGDLTNLALAVRAAGCVLRGEVVSAAAAAGHIHVCQWLRQQGCLWGDTMEGGTLETAAKAGQREMCEWLLSNGCPGLHGAICAAARGGHLGLMEWLWQQLPPEEQAAPDTFMVAAVAHGGDLPTLQRFYSEWDAVQQELLQDASGDDEDDDEDEDDGGDDDENDVRYLMDQFEILASACGSPTPDWPEKIGWLEAQGCTPSATASRNAAQLPAEAAVDRLRWLQQRGYPLNRSALDVAAGAGNLAAVEFLLGVPVTDVGTIDCLAAAGGHLRVLQALDIQDFPLDAQRCLSEAAEEGHLPIVSWLASSMFGLALADLQEHAVRPAARSGSIELVDWLAGRGCDFSRVDDIFECAAVNGCEAMLERMVELGCRMPGGGVPYMIAFQKGDLAMLRCLHRLGCPWGRGDLITALIDKGWDEESLSPMLPTLRWLVEAGCPVDWDEALAVANDPWDGEVEHDVVAWVEEELQRSQGR